MITLLTASLAVAAPPPPIVGGSPSERAEVVALGATRGQEHALFCSAVVLAPTALLTAAHCVDEALDHQGWVPDARSGPEASEDLVAWTDWVQHPEWGEGTAHHADLAVIYLERPLDGTAPAGLAGLLDPPGALTLVGYGWTGDGAEDPGVQREVGVTVARWDAEHVWTWESEANLCDADSGGAVLDAGGGLVAVASFVWDPDGGLPSCEGGGGAVRVDAWADWVEARRLEAPEPGGGCGCDGSGGAWAWLPLVLVLARRRR